MLARSSNVRARTDTSAAARVIDARPHRIPANRSSRRPTAVPTVIQTARPVSTPARRIGEAEPCDCCRARVDSACPGPTSNNTAPVSFKVSMPSANRTVCARDASPNTQDRCLLGRDPCAGDVRNEPNPRAFRFTAFTFSVNGAKTGCIIAEWKACDVCSLVQSTFVARSFSSCSIASFGPATTHCDGALTTARSSSLFRYRSHFSFG